MDHQEPVSRLLGLGEDEDAAESWPDYLKLGLGREHVPELIALARGSIRWEQEPDLDPWRAVHAWRALGQLRAAEAVPALVELLQAEASDAAAEELPEVLVMMGPPALPALGEALSALRGGDDAWLAAVVANSVRRIAGEQPEARAEAVSILLRQLEAAEDQDPELNGVLIAELLDLNAVEAAPAMEAAFAGGNVDDTIAGDWEDVQVELGLIPERTTPREYTALAHGLGLRDEPSRPAGRPGASQAKKKKKQQKKAQKAARQKNRTKKR